MREEPSPSHHWPEGDEAGRDKQAEPNPSILRGGIDSLKSPNLKRRGEHDTHDEISGEDPPSCFDQWHEVHSGRSSRRTMLGMER